jgi:hypothetical protein
MKSIIKIFIGISILCVLYLIIAGILYIIDKKNGKRENNIESSFYFKLSFIVFLVLSLCIRYLIFNY